MTGKVASVSQPRPKSPPEYPDLFGKRRQLSRVQMLEREIGFLQNEIKYEEDVHPASLPCKEVTDFVVANSDPFIPTNARAHKSCPFWKWLCGSQQCLSLNLSRLLRKCCNCSNSNSKWGSRSCSTSCCVKTKSCLLLGTQNHDSKCCKMHRPSCCFLNCCSPERALPCCTNCLLQQCKRCVPSCHLKCSKTALNLCFCSCSCVKYSSCNCCYICS